MTRWPFEDNATHNSWSRIRATGFCVEVPGCIYDGARLDGGMPLGGLGTGYINLEGDGRFGLCSALNDIVPPRKLFFDWLTLEAEGVRLPLSSAPISYFGHYPVADLLAEFREVPLALGLRAFTPLIPGDAAASNLPAALFELALTNRGDHAMRVSLELEMRAPEPKTGGLLWAGEGVTCSRAGERVSGAAAVELAAGETRHIRFVLAWYLPNWRDSGNEAHVHRYGTRYSSVQDVAEHALEHYDTLLARVLGWQAVLYGAEMPGWMADALVQGLYSLAKNTVWIAKTRHDEWWPEDGWFTHNESHTGCPITETMVCRMHGHFPALFFFPELEYSTLVAFRHFQIADGEIPFSYGAPTSMRDPRYHCQHPLNPGQYAQMVWRLWRRTGNRAKLEALYDSAKRAIRYQYSLDDDGDGLINEQAHVGPGENWPANQFYDIWPWQGTSAYVAGTWLATLTCGEALAQAVGDEAFAAECRERLERGKQAYEDKLWNGAFYRVWADPANGEQLDVSLGNQLMAEWCTSVAGLEAALPPEHVATALDTVWEWNVAATPYGAVNAAQGPAERYASGYSLVNDFGEHTFVGENLCTAMTYLYRGERERGLEVAKRIYEAIALKTLSPWNQRCLISSYSGLPVWGDDYYSNLAVWALPMALAGQDVASFSAPGGLLAKLLAAANHK
ncbi:MAG: hypothetical protein GXY52_08005 [Chloroflexi bacterium]|nr:hypothetical protein [Chloroflexota bacterium]